MWEILTEQLKKKDIKIILDCWNGFARERREITAKLRELKTDRIEAWYFVTPEKTCIEWLLAKGTIELSVKPDKNFGLTEAFQQMHIESLRHDYQLYHRQSVNRRQGFDAIRKINPLKISPISIQI